MKSLIIPYLYNINHPIDVIKQTKKDRISIVTRLIISAVLLSFLGFFGAYITKQNTLPSFINAFGALLGWMFTFYAGWKIADSIKAYYYFYKQLPMFGFNDMQNIIMRNIPSCEYITFITENFGYATKADYDIIVQYIHSCNNNDIQILESIPTIYIP